MILFRSHSSINQIIFLFLLFFPMQPSLSVAVSCWTQDDCNSLYLLCINGTCSPCTLNSEGNAACVNAYGSMQTCQEYQGQAICSRESFLSDFNWLDVLVSVILILGCAVAAGGGIGGGGIVVPVLILVGNFSLKQATALSNTMISGAHLANIIYFMRKRHPSADRPLIFYMLSFFLMPLALGGTTFGKIFNSLFPSFAILVILVLVLTVTALKTAMSGIKIYKSETLKIGSPSLFDVQQSERGDYDEEEEEHSSSMESDQESPLLTHQLSRQTQIKHIIDTERKTPWLFIAAQTLIIGLVAFDEVSRGTRTSKSLFGVQSCTVVYWFLLFGPLTIFIFLTILIGWHFLSMTKTKETLRYPFKPGDIHWTKKKVFFTALAGFASGILASCVGVGGGMVLNPLMLEIGVLPDVTAATTSFMVFFTSVMATVQFLIGDNIPWADGVYLASLGFLASVLGLLGLDRLVKKYKKKSLIVFSVVFVIIVSTIMLAVIGTIDTVALAKARANWYSVRSICY